jgi:hypothetical protein
MTFTPAQGPALPEAMAVAAAEEAGAETAAEPVCWLLPGAEQAARESRRPAAARVLAAAVRVVVKVTSQG